VEVAVVRSLPRKLSVDVWDELSLNAFKATGEKIAQIKAPIAEKQQCTVKISKTREGREVLWLLFLVKGGREFGLSLPHIWKEYEEGVVDFEAGGEDGFLDQRELEEYLRLYLHL
tara:strand:+ start:185466 stop:185810 length:345 start_codon:yes stop_codon:yes gene_type:complete